MIRCNLTYSIGDTFFIPTIAESKYFRNMYLAGNSLKTGGTDKAVNFDGIDTILDMIGSDDIFYRGVEIPALANYLTPGAPMLVKDNFIVFNNQPETHFESDVFPGLVAPFETHHVYADQPEQPYEGRFPGGNARDYEGKSEFFNRVINSSYGFLPESSLPPFYKLNYSRTRVNANATVDYWRNNVFIANIPLQNEPGSNPPRGDLADFQDGNFTKSMNGVGVNTNVMDFWFAEMGVVSRALTVDEATELYNSIANRWGMRGYDINVDFTQKVRFDNLEWNKVGETIVPSFTIVNDSGKTLAPIDEWEWEWRYKNAQTNFAIQALIGNTRIIPTSAYSANNGSTIKSGTIKWGTRVKFTDGSKEDTFLYDKHRDIPVGTGHS